MTKVFKTCNCCLDHNKVVRLMGVRAKVKYCKSCKLRTIWGDADQKHIDERNEQIAFMENMLAEILADEAAT